LTGTMPWLTRWQWWHMGTPDPPYPQDELTGVLNSVLPPEVQGRDRTEYVAVGIALNKFFAIKYEDLTMDDLDKILREVFDKGYNCHKLGQ
jgi:hypothetical protein